MKWMSMRMMVVAVCVMLWCDVVLWCSVVMLCRDVAFWCCFVLWCCAVMLCVRCCVWWCEWCGWCWLGGMINFMLFWGFAFRQTNERTLVVVESLSRLKKKSNAYNIQIIFMQWQRFLIHCPEWELISGNTNVLALERCS